MKIDKPKKLISHAFIVACACFGKIGKNVQFHPKNWKIFIHFGRKLVCISKCLWICIYSQLKFCEFSINFWVLDLWTLSFKTETFGSLTCTFGRPLINNDGTPRPISSGRKIEKGANNNKKAHEWLTTILLADNRFGSSNRCAVRVCVCTRGSYSPLYTYTVIPRWEKTASVRADEHRANDTISFNKLYVAKWIEY